MGESCSHQKEIVTSHHPWDVNDLKEPTFPIQVSSSLLEPSIQFSKELDGDELWYVREVLGVHDRQKSSFIVSHVLKSGAPMKWTGGKIRNLTARILRVTVQRKQSKSNFESGGSGVHEAGYFHTKKNHEITRKTQTSKNTPKTKADFLIREVKNAFLRHQKASWGLCGGIGVGQTTHAQLFILALIIVYGHARYRIDGSTVGYYGHCLNVRSEKTWFLFGVTNIQLKNFMEANVLEANATAQIPLLDNKEVGSIMILEELTQQVSLQREETHNLTRLVAFGSSADNVS